jgi:hypothetical protein
MNWIMDMNRCTSEPAPQAAGQCDFEALAEAAERTQELQMRLHGGEFDEYRIALCLVAAACKAFAAASTAPQAVQARHPTLEECEKAGRGPDNWVGKPYSSGNLPDTPEERARFEAYMRGHCWYVGEYDEELRIYEVGVRQLYGVWRDRGSLPTIHGARTLASASDAAKQPDSEKQPDSDSVYLTQAVPSGDLQTALPDDERKLLEQIEDALDECGDYLESWKDLSGGTAYRKAESALAALRVRLGKESWK